MTDKEYEKLKKRLQKIINKWLPVLGLDRERIRFKYLRTYDGSDHYTVAKCYPLWQYKTHNVEFLMPAVQDVDDAELEEDVVHELCHILIAPASGNSAPEEDKHYTAQVELATQNVAFALIDAFNKGKRSK